MEIRGIAFQALVFSALAAATASRAPARPLEIIHTNDLHSHLDHANDPGRGSYAAVKATIDRLKFEARSQGIDTLVLDAGDFLEDSQFYLADRGAYAWKAMAAMGYDAVEIGNHDWLAGMAELDREIGLAKPPFVFLGANFLFDWDNPNLTKYMRRAFETYRAGARIAVYGLTTDEVLYSWAAKPTLIYKPEWEAAQDLPALRARNDFVIGLTHLGVKIDRQLVERVPGFDLIVGGHSHTELFDPIVETDPSGKRVPIVQAGSHGDYVGDLLVDVVPGKPLEILRYRLVDVYSNGPRDAAMDRIARDARDELDREYGADWLREVVGSTEVPLLNAVYQGHATVWSEFSGEAIRRAVGADVAIDSTEFEGFEQPVGPITREQLFVLYPRILSFGERYGYTIWTARVNGKVLKYALLEALALGMPINPAGLTTEMDSSGHAIDFLIDGHPLNTARAYKVALPEAIARGAFGTNQYLELLFRNAHDSGIPVWVATERHLKETGGVIREPMTRPTPIPSPTPVAAGVNRG
jgi:2',3'-cyclic-nucleotide 2'-phosphodiesterase (5'-nucleotidase family)